MDKKDLKHLRVSTVRDILFRLEMDPNTSKRSLYDYFKGKEGSNHTRKEIFIGVDFLDKKGYVTANRSGVKLDKSYLNEEGKINDEVLKKVREKVLKVSLYNKKSKRELQTNYRDGVAKKASMKREKEEAIDLTKPKNELEEILISIGDDIINKIGPYISYNDERDLLIDVFVDLLKTKKIPGKKDHVKEFYGREFRTSNILIKYKEEYYPLMISNLNSINNTHIAIIKTFINRLEAGDKGYIVNLNWKLGKTQVMEVNLNEEAS